MGITFAWEYGPLYFWLTLSFLIVIFGLLAFTFYKVCRRKAAFITLAIVAVLMFVSFIFSLIYVAILSAAIFITAITVCLFANLGDLRAFLANPFRKVSAKAANFGVEKIYNREVLYKKIETAVLALSKSKTGAIITFEKNTSLKDIIQNGIPVHAPVSPELLLTIFYEGTRLHDGAVIIHGNEIVAASVFFTPTTKPFAGKYGSRHRAAIGISEISDAVTVVVSEETGRISFAVNGELESVDQSIFLRVFENYMNDKGSSED
jgi:diadenylate cyclase